MPTTNLPGGRAQSQAKILRACVVQTGRVIEEQRLKRRDPLTIGSAPKNTFVVSEPTLPNSHELFAVRGGVYELVLTEGMRGRISVENRTVDIASLKAQGLLKKRGEYYRLPLTDGHRGKVLIGETTLIFQFVAPPPEVAKPQLPLAARGSVWKAIDWPYTIALLVLFALELPFVAYLRAATPPQEPATLENLSERWASLIVPERKREQVTKAEEGKAKGGGEAKRKAKDAGEPDEASKAKAAAARKAKIRESIAGRGMLAILGTTGESGQGAVADVFGAGGIGGDLDSAFEGISGVGVPAAGGHTARGGGTGEAASIGGLATAGGGKVGLGGKQEARVGTITTEAPEVDGALDASAIAKVVQARKRMLQDCYEKELKRDPSLQGKIEIEFTIGEDGSVQSASIANNRMGSDAVGDCIVSRLRRWRFPKPDGGSVTVTFPFIFTPSS